MTSSIDTDPATRSLYADMASAGLQPLWTVAGELLPSSPRPQAVPHRWDGAGVRSLVARAGELVPLGVIGDRRAVALANPGLGSPWATPTLWAAIQQLNPGESAPAHRHTAAAIRFVVEGHRVWTTVEGDECTMSPGDLVLTPAWTWHEHISASDDPMVWFDGLDLPLVHAIDAMFHELHPDGRQPVIGRNRSERFGFGGRMPAYGSPALGDDRLLVYRWEDTDRALDHLIRADGGVARLEFREPATGDAVLPTLGCAMLRIEAGTSTSARRRCASSVFYVHRGNGVSRIGDTKFSWRAGDVLAAPSWATVEHTATDSADLFELTDEPVMRALGLYREDVAAR
jgi:gentisate 1,2-dioxygenase